ncbi:MAG: hypothetical protein R3F61_31675 [Myxococcota bacterium]
MHRLKIVSNADGSASVVVVEQRTVAQVVRRNVALRLLLTAIFVLATLVLAGVCIFGVLQTEVGDVQSLFVALSAMSFGFLVLVAGTSMTWMSVVQRVPPVHLQVDSRGLRLDGTLTEWASVVAIDGDDVSIDLGLGRTTRTVDLSLYPPEDVQRIRTFLRSTLATRSEIAEDPTAARAQLRDLIGASLAL